MPTSEQLAREARASREQLNRTIDELRARLSGSSIVDEVTGFLAQTGGSVLPDRPVAKARYALPLALIGAGVALLAMEAKRSEQRAEQRRLLAAEAAARQSAALAAAANNGYGLTEVESGSLAPAPSERENQNQRSLPL
jgi:hypothetical protein